MLNAELLLVAVGRGPVSAGLGYEQAGVAMDRGYVVADAYCRTSVPTISAVGDLTPGLQHPRRLRRGHPGGRAGGKPPDVTPIDYDGVPRITYSDPEVASVGITEATAAARGIETTEFTYNLGGNGKRHPAGPGRGEGHRHRPQTPAASLGRCWVCTSSVPRSAS